jgi:prephenate dehydrogenase
MGGSLALALKDHCREIVGIDTQAGTVDLALKTAAVSRASTRPSDLLPEADVVILAAPVCTILELIGQLPDLHPGSPVVMDIGSTKANICREMAELPERFDPIGGHPMCGKETSGLENADAALFKRATFALTPLQRSSARARSIASEIVGAVGAFPLLLSPDLHDRWTAATSHAPYLLSIALVLATGEEAAPLVGPGFRSSSRLAGSSPQMMLDILSSNHENVRKALHAVHKKLYEIDRLLDEGDEAELAELLSRGRVARQSLLNAADTVERE